jgi:adenosylhomocysteine nucleosidase
LSRPGIVIPLRAESKSFAHLSLPEACVPSGLAHPLLKVSGIGEKRARRAAASLVENGATALISYGSAGGLHPSSRSGVLVLPQKVISPSGKSFFPDRSWLKRLESALRGQLTLSKGVLVESQNLLRSPREKRRLHQISGAVAVDMESAAIARVSEEAGIPFMAVRAVVDPPHMTLPRHAVEAMDSYGRLQPLHLLRSLLEHPGELFPLLRLGWCFREAMAALKTAANLTDYRFKAP